MENKYYTPEEEEFHVGFKYEALWGVENVDGEWLKETFSKDQSIHSTEDTVRVKKLDREDIESEDFECDERFQEFSETSKTNIYTKIKKYNGDDARLMLFHNTVNNLVSISWANPAGASYVAEKRFLKLSIATITVQINNNIFLGTIKNKSKLKDVLKMIEI